MLIAGVIANFPSTLRAGAGMSTLVEQERYSKRVTGRTDEDERRERDEDAAQCRRTGGAWRTNFVSCACAPNFVFTSDRGCIHFAAWQQARDAQEPLRQQLHPLNARQDDAQHWQDAQVESKFPASDWAQYLHSPPLAATQPSALLNLMELPYSRVLYDRRLAYTSVGGSAASVDDFAARCHELSDCEATCARATEAWRRLLEPTPVAYRLVASALAAHWTEDRVMTVATSYGPVQFVVSAANGLPMVRLLAFAQIDGASLSLFLDARGHLIGGKFRSERVADAAGDAALTQSDAVFDGTLSVVAGVRQKLLGQRSRLQALASACAQGTGAGRDANGAASAPRALAFENKFDLRLTSLAPSLLCDPVAAADFLATGRLAKALIGPQMTEVQHLALLATEASATSTSHGSEVISRLVAGLPEVRVDVVPSVVLQSRERGQILDQVADRIQRHGVRVVNISQEWAYETGPCEEVVGPLIARFADSVLFVAAAGNEGAELARNACPRGLVGRFPNLLVVGGSDGAGMHASSNFGSEVTVAAAMNQQVLGLAPTNGGTSQSWREVSITQEATSLAAPAVANAALRLWSERPEAKVDEIVAALRAATADSGLPVAWGGELDCDRVGWGMPAASAAPSPPPRSGS